MPSDKLEVLLAEATHARDALSRTVGTIYTLHGVVVPALFGALAIVGKESIGPENLDVLGFAVVLLGSTALSYGNGLWMEAHQYLGYMYLKLFPRMYALAELGGEPNFSQYQARTRQPYTWIPAVIFNGTIFLGIAVLGLGTIVVADVAPDWRRLVFFSFGLAALIAAAVCAFLMVKSARELMGALRGIQPATHPILKPKGGRTCGS